MLLCIAITFFFRSYEHYPSGDELAYKYVWEQDDPVDLWHEGHRFEREVHTPAQAFQSQVIHFQKVNGRFWVHAVEQYMSNDGRFTVFCVLNTVVFLFFIYLIARFVSREKLPRSILLWTLTAFSLLILFPYQNSLWTSINYGLNYLWPSVLSLLVVMFWKKILDGNLSSRYVPLLPILGFLCGFSHEGFAVGLSGGMLLYYCLHAKSFRGRILWLTLPLFLATAIMVLSPGNIHRFMGDSTIQDTPISLRIANGVDNYVHLWFFWLLVVGATAALLFDRKHLGKFVGKNIPLICIYTVGFVFSLIANTAPYSHTFTELISLLIIFFYLRDLNLFEKNRVSTSVVACVIGVILIAHQFIVVRDNRRIFEYHKRIVAEYKASPDGLVCFDLPKISRVSEPFIRTWGNPVMYFQMMSSVYFNGKKQALFLTPADIEAITSPKTFFTEKIKTKGTAPVYKKEGCDFYWVKPEEIRKDLKLEARYHPVDFSHDAPILVKFLFALRPGSYPEKEYVKVDTVHTRYGDSYRIYTPLIRRISEINVVE